MKYSKQAYEYALNQLEERRRRSTRELELHRKEISRAIPEISRIQQDLASTGTAVVRAVFSGAEDVPLLVEGLRLKNEQLQEQQRALLRSRGYPDNYLEEGHQCALCKDTGYVDAKPCQCLNALLQEYAYRQLNEISSIQDCTFQTFDLSFYPDTVSAGLGVSPRQKMQEVLEYCRHYAQNFDEYAPSILMLGQTGLGKTHLSLSIVNEVLKKGVPAVYGSMLNLMNRMERDKFSGGNSTDTLDHLLEAPLLVLDDLGAEFDTSFTNSIVYHIINTRISERRPVIINTNLSMSELEKKYTPRIVSRLIGNYDFLYFYGTDVRQLKKQREFRA